MYNVWIVDDEPLILEGLSNLVDWPSLKLVLAGKAEDGLDALNQIEAQQAQVDILITDIAMPEMDGLTLLRALKGRNPEMKGIILSGYDEFNLLKEGMKIGIENYLLKPINLEELNQTLIIATENLDRSKIESLSQDQVEMFKDNILYRWVMNRIGMEQWKLCSELLELRLKTSAVAAAVITTIADNRVDTGDQPLRIREVSHSFMESSGLAFLCFQNSNDDTVLLIGADNISAETLGGLVGQLKALGEKLSREFGLKPLIALGSLDKSFDQAPDSYQNALLALEYALLFPEDVVLTYDHIACLTESPHSPYVDADSYNRLLLAHDLESLHQQIESDFNSASHVEGMTPLRLRHGAVEMVIQMKKVLKDFNPNPSVFKSYHEIINQILSSATLEELKRLVHSMAKLVSDLLSERQKISPVIRQIIKHVETSYMEEHSLKSLAQQYHVHPFYLGQLFQKETHQSFSDYLNKLRIERAVELMKTSSMKTQGIAGAVGYWDTAHFYKHFKKYIGVSPAQYRKLL